MSAITATSLEQARLFQDAKLAEVARIVGDIGHDMKNLLMPLVCGAGLLEAELRISRLIRRICPARPRKTRSGYVPMSFIWSELRPGEFSSVWRKLQIV